ncbi:hypothetical protein [Streptomyces sp. NBC_01207]|uniref:hypothetical protein n=1 Tax=Streptomyces sp. NBC_01207 TaxID=2903772 RepID=UPI002E133716|nr:hypothetical protein OG457_49065 [Streptomyces sp. NBC_01207]
MTTIDDPTLSVDRAQVRRAAARIAPAHSDFMDQHRAWYALVGTNLYYVRELLAQATGEPAPLTLSPRGRSLTRSASPFSPSDAGASWTRATLPIASSDSAVDCPATAVAYEPGALQLQGTGSGLGEVRESTTSRHAAFLLNGTAP